MIRLLADLAEVDVRAPDTVLSERLSEWLDINQAIALSTALERRPAAPTCASPPVHSAEAECALVRTALTTGINGDRAFQDLDTPNDPALLRQRYFALQQMMETRIGELRRDLRERLARASDDLARLAAVDAAMERALVRRERSLLARIPALLDRHVKRLQVTVPNDTDTPDDEPSASASQPWRELFHQDMRRVLLAELEVRLHPIEGLLAALRTLPQGP